jgi:ABC-2 type transport system permease protein
MGLLLKIEWLKIKKYPAFWWMLAIVMLTYPSINYMFYNIYNEFTQGKEMTNNIAKMLLGNPFAFPETFHTVAYFSSFFVLLPAILVIMLITNEYNYRTHKQNIIDGWSRKDFMASKLIDVAIISFVVMTVYMLVALGFGVYADPENMGRIASGLLIAIAYAAGLNLLGSFCKLIERIMNARVLKMKTSSFYFVTTHCCALEHFNTHFAQCDF